MGAAFAARLRQHVRYATRSECEQVTIERRGRKGRKVNQDFFAAFAAFAFYARVTQSDTLQAPYSRSVLAKSVQPRASARSRSVWPSLFRAWKSAPCAAR